MIFKRPSLHYLKSLITFIRISEFEWETKNLKHYFLSQVVFFFHVYYLEGMKLVIRGAFKLWIFFFRINLMGLIVEETKP